MKLPDQFEILNVETKIVVRCVKTWDGKFLCQWTDLIGPTSNVYTQEEIERSIRKGTCKIKEGDGMRLAKKFMYVHEDAQDGTVFTAEELDTGDFRISWLDDGHSNFKTLHYDRMDVHTFIVTGQWRIREVFPQKEEEMKYNGKKINSSCNTYIMRASTEGDRYIFVGTTGETVGMEYDYGYTDEMIDSYLTDRGWTLVEDEPAVSLEPSDDIVADAWPFPRGLVVAAPDEEIPPLVPEGFSLETVRKFVKEFPQYTLELDEEYIVVKPVVDSHGERSVVYLVKTEVELEAIFDAIRTLERFADRG